MSNFSIRTEIEILPADNNSDRIIGWIFEEKIGVGIYNMRGMIKEYYYICY